MNGRLSSPLSSLASHYDVAVVGSGYGAGVALRKTDTALRDEFNAAIKAIRANGVYKKINDKYFEFDIYGGK